MTVILLITPRTGRFPSVFSSECWLEVARTGGTAPAVFNAANEAAVEQFLAGRIRFVNIVELVEDCLNKHKVKTNVCLAELLEADSWARKEVVSDIIAQNV